MENINPESNPLKDIQSDEMKQDIATVLKFVLFNLILYIFKLPYALFKKSISRLFLLNSKGALNIAKTDSKWPFLSWLKTYIIDFGFDAYTFLAYVLGYPLLILGSLYGFIFQGLDFSDMLETLLYGAFGLYFIPLGVAIAKDVMQLLILPFRKYIDWANKPAQHQDITHSGSIRNN